MQVDPRDEEEKIEKNIFTKGHHTKESGITSENSQDQILSNESYSDSEEIESDLNDIDESYSFDDDMSEDKAQLRKRIGKISFKHKALIRKLSKGFTI